MGLGSAEIVIIIGMLLCLLVVPALILIGFLTLNRRLDKVEQDLKALQEKQDSAG